ncbi:MAG: hypothetical protein Q9225_001912 [Loekoesia sp. 1 TL-2023]
MKRSAEKTFGPSPEALSTKKRQKSTARSPTRFNVNLKTESVNERIEQSDTLFLSSDIEQRHTRSANSRAKIPTCGSPDSVDNQSESNDHDPAPARPSNSMKSKKSKGTHLEPSEASGNVIVGNEKLSNLAVNQTSTSTSILADNVEDGKSAHDENIPTTQQDRTEVTNPKNQLSRYRKPPRGHSSGEGDGKILVAVDFGTTYSGLCWAYTSTPEIQMPIDQWPDSLSGGLEGMSSEKVPTELQYTDQGYNWGFQIPFEAERLQWFKLDLDRQLEKAQSCFARDFPDEKAALLNHDQSPESLVTDYLTALREHFEAVFKKNLPLSVSSDVPVKYIITVPAMWSEGAAAKTKACAEQAGLGEGSAMQLISEPEAAAIYALAKIAPYKLGIGDTFVICDAGGGTVDLITYKIIALKPILRIVEVVPGRGDLCGSCFLNRRFASFLRNKLGSHRSWRESMLEERKRLPQAKRSSNLELQVKCCYMGSKDVDYSIPVPGFPENKTLGVRKAMFRLKGTDLFDIVEPIIQNVLDLVSQQIDATCAVKLVVKAVLMVGGFGRNEYLQKRVQQAVADRNIEVWKPPHGWTAVARGALMKGLAEINPKTAVVGVSGRVARNHYGTESAKEYNDSIHPAGQRIWSPSNDRYEVNTYDWFVMKGDRITEKKPIRLPYHMEFPVSDGALESVKATIVKCVDHENDGPPLFVGDGEVENVANLEVPLSLIPVKSLKKRVDKDGMEWYIIDFAIRVTCFGSETIYELLHGKINKGHVTAEYV